MSEGAAHFTVPEAGGGGSQNKSWGPIPVQAPDLDNHTIGFF